jgi:hypothetical protein
MQWITRLKLKWQAWRQGANVGIQSPTDASTTKPLLKRRSLWIATALVVIPLYYLMGMLFFSSIDDDPRFRPSPADLPAGGSVAVAMASGLMDREVNKVGWTPNNPWFFPTAFIDNLPNYQEGVRRLTTQFVLEARDQLGRLRGTGSVDPNLETAVARLNYPGDIWLIGHNFPYIGMSSESSYREAIDALRAYNQSAASGAASYERRVDALNAVLDRMALSLGDTMAKNERYVANHGGTLFETQSDDIFYQTKGQAHAALMILTGLREDFAPTIRERGLANLWGEMTRQLQEVNDMNPLIVLNGKPGSGVLKSHLAEQGFRMSNARNKLREITDVLQK